MTLTLFSPLRLRSGTNATSLGIGRVLPDGTLSESLNVPDSLRQGTYAVRVVGQDRLGRPFGTDVALVVGASSLSSPDSNGLQVSLWHLIVAPLLVILLAGALVRRRAIRA